MMPGLRTFFQRQKKTRQRREIIEIFDQLFFANKNCTATFNQPFTFSPASAQPLANQPKMSTSSTCSSKAVAPATVWVTVTVECCGMRAMVDTVAYSKTRYDFFSRGFLYNNRNKLSGTSLLQTVSKRVRECSGLLLDLDPVCFESAACADEGDTRHYAVHCVFEDPEDLTGFLHDFDDNVAAFERQYPSDTTMTNRSPGLALSPMYYHSYKDKRIVVRSFLRRGAKGHILSQQASANLIGSDSKAKIVLRKTNVTEGPFSGTVAFVGSPLKCASPPSKMSPELRRFCRRGPVISQKFFREYSTDYYNLAGKQVQLRLKLYPADRAVLERVTLKYGYLQMGCSPRRWTKAVWQWPMPAPSPAPRQRPRRVVRGDRETSWKRNEQPRVARDPSTNKDNLCWRKSRKELFAAVR